jgi:hypothetical protein
MARKVQGTHPWRSDRLSKLICRLPYCSSDLIVTPLYHPSLSFPSIAMYYFIMSAVVYSLTVCTVSVLQADPRATVKSVKLPLGDATSLDASLDHVDFLFLLYHQSHSLLSSYSNVKRYSRTKKNRKREETSREV